MAVYAVTHDTAYTYDEKVSICHNLGYLLPRTDPRCRWRVNNVTIRPTPAVIQKRVDVFGNRGLFFSIQEPHRELVVSASGIVEVIEIETPTDVGMTWEAARERLRIPRNAEDLAASEFRFASPYVTWPDGIAALAADSFPPSRPLVEAAIELTGHIHRTFAYDPQATTVQTTVAELLAKRRGVCQDLAHVQIACLRSLGLAARYVSGYLRTLPPPGKERLVGADASHAWISVYVPGTGWLDLDPTNDAVPGTEHIPIAVGRDYGDVCPLRGVILGGGNHTVRVSVDVAPLT